MASRTAAAARAVVVVCIAAASACGKDDPASPPSTGAPGSTQPSILLVTLDTTRADAIGPGARGIDTTAFNALAARGRRFEQAYTTAPETLPAHSSIMTGLYPGGHGVHENARHLGAAHPVVAERLRAAGYRTAAFVSSFVLARRFGLARGFEVYDDELRGGMVERSAKATTDTAVAFLDRAPKDEPLFVWVHYFDPHAPYAPPEPLRSQYRETPYLGEVAAMDAQLGRLTQAFEARARPPAAFIVVADHGEGLGAHGESQHGHLLYQETMRVPLIVVGPGIDAGVSQAPVSTRRVFHTVLDWAGQGGDGSLRLDRGEVVVGEAMKPFLSYGWQPQVMAVSGTQKAILAGKIEAYDLGADPHEQRDLGSGTSLPGAMRQALEDYPVPAAGEAPVAQTLSDEARRNLASLGYVSGGAAPVVRRNAPRPVDMAHLFDTIERASALFVQERYADAIPSLERIRAADPYNLDAALRLATAHSALGHGPQALEMFKAAARIAPSSPDVRTYLALHYARGEEWERAVPLLETIVNETPERLPAVEALATLRERQGRIEDALELRRRIYSMREPTAGELIQVGRMAMSVQRTTAAIEAFEGARARQGDAFEHDLELGVLYLAARNFEQARAALDRVPPSHPEYPMALFKRAQVSVLLNEPDRAARIEAARRRADSTTRGLIEKERLFQREAGSGGR